MAPIFFICVAPQHADAVLLASLTGALTAIAFFEVGGRQGAGRGQPPDGGDSRWRVFSEFRAITMIGTSVMILAVDFPTVFAREFSKNLYAGYSPMDLGVGSFVFVNGMAAGMRRRRCSGRGSGREGASRKPAGEPRVEKSVLLQNVPVLLLGLARFLTVALSGHYVPPEEYGVHWNFFVTLALVQIAGDSALAGSADNYALPLLLGVLTLGLTGALLEFVPVAWDSSASKPPSGHRTTQTSSTFRDYALAEILPDRRNSSLFEANKEGLLSLPGFAALYLLSVALGRFVGRTPSATKQGLLQRTSASFAALGFFAGVLVFVLDRKFGRLPSRRCCDASYVLHILSCNCVSFAALHLVDEILLGPNGREPLPCLFRGLSRSMLFFFLLTNLLTGLVGQLCRTLLVPRQPAIILLILYAAIWMTLGYFFGKLDWKVKFW
eukprot:g7148.t1